MRVVAVSPDDVQAERKRLAAVIEELNRRLARSMVVDPPKQNRYRPCWEFIEPCPGLIEVALLTTDHTALGHLVFASWGGGANAPIR